MASLLEGQIDVLGQQLQSLSPRSLHSLENLEQGIVLLLFLYDQIHSAEHHMADRDAVAGPSEQDSIRALYGRWLASADLILPVLRELKSGGREFTQTPLLLKACLRARGLIASNAITTQPRHAQPLEEVERELQG